MPDTVSVWKWVDVSGRTIAEMEAVLNTLDYHFPGDRRIPDPHYNTIYQIVEARLALRKAQAYTIPELKN